MKRERATKALRIYSPSLTGYAIYDSDYICVSATPGFERLVGTHYLDKDEVIYPKYETRWVGSSNVSTKEW